MNRTLLGAAILLVCGCRAPLTEVVVSVNTDLDVPEELDGIVVTVTGPRGDLERAVGAISSRTQLPSTLGIVRAAGPIGDVIAVVEGQRDGATVIERRASFAWVPGETRILRLDLLRACVDVRCGPDQTCGENGCRPTVVDPDELLPYTPLDASLPARDGGRDGGREAGIDAAMQDSGGRDGGGMDGGVDGGTCNPSGDCRQGANGCTCDRCACDLSCDSNCAVSCIDSGRCEVAAADTSNFGMVCDDSACDVAAARSGNTEVTCRGTARCDVDCTDASNCEVFCEAPSMCLLRCGGSSNCTLQSCTAPLSCTNGVSVCNRACPG